MDVNYVQTAAAVASILAPFTPYLIEGAKGAAKGLGGELGKGAFEKAKVVWNKIKTHHGDDPKINGAVLVLSADPEDETSKHVLTKAIAERLKDDGKFAQELLDIMGGQEGIQLVLAGQSSWVEDVQQEMKGPGTQTVRANDDSVIKGVRQIKK